MRRRQMKHLLILGTVSLLGSVFLQADTVGGEVSFGFYSHSPSGYASYTDPYTGLAGTIADVKNTLHWKNDTDLIFKTYIEHPMPILPNIKLAFAHLSQEGKGDVSDFVWGSINIPFEGSIENSFKMTKYDLTLYYELLDNWAEIDTGVTLGYLDGNIDMSSLSGFSSLPKAASTVSTNYSLFIPTLYGKARFTIPATDLSFQFEGDIFSYDKTTYYTYEISTRYTFGIGVGLEGGWKALYFNSTNLVDGLTLDIDFSGPYAALVWDF